MTVMAVVSACATGSALHNAQKAADHGDWDSAVAYYREALNSDPSRVDIKVALERAMRTASGEHLKRAKQLEEQDQLSGAAAEYRLLLERVVLPALGKKRVADVTRRDVAKLHRRDHYRPTD